MDQIEEIKKIFGSDLQENVPLKNYTTMKVGGEARYFYPARKINDLINAIVSVEELKIPYFILGGGSNTIFSDRGFDGLVILNRTGNIAFLPDKAQVIVDSGVSLKRLIMETANHDLGGLEPLYGIPGTIGGAIYGNCGAFGMEIANFIKSLTVLKPDGKIARYDLNWLMPEYRSTKIKKLKKQKKSTVIILSVTLQLMHQKKEEIVKKLQQFRKMREEKQPYDKPSSGSVFRNIGTEKEKTAGYILEQVGAKKIKIGGA